MTVIRAHWGKRNGTRPPQDHHRAGIMWVLAYSQHCSDTDLLQVLVRSRALSALARDDMRRWPRALSALPLLLLLLLLCMLACAADWELTLLHTNDVHARVEETNKDSGKCTKAPCFAGVARRFTKIKELRKAERNLLLLDAGDQFQGTVWFNYYKGAEAAFFMNKLGYDAMVSNPSSYSHWSDVNVRRWSLQGLHVRGRKFVREE
ncbi:hypothetical protein NFI96_001496 [Prochilodus magdalenae]|nr:hypothetical protein NFI96_001496 [Prochilodus magdalenae]